MTHTLRSAPEATATLTHELAALGPVHLDVTDGERSLGFWRDLVGLRVRDDDAERLILGTERDPLLVLHPVASSPVRPGHAGLYHLAIHLPDEPEFARVLARLIARRVPISPTDHVVSKAIYLSDPDGIGLELTLETPERVRAERTTADGIPEVIDADGRRRSGREPLDVDQVLRALNHRDIDVPLVPGTKIGHVHLQVNNLDAARRFYRDALGFVDGVYWPTFGMADLHANGASKHVIAISNWQGAGASQPPSGTAGLRHFTIDYGTPARLDTALKYLPVAARHLAGHLVHDPSGNPIVLTDMS